MQVTNANSFKTLSVTPQLHDTKVTTDDSIYWKNYEFPVTNKEYGSVTHIDIQPTFPHNIAVSASTRVQIYCQKTDSIVKTFTRFHDTVYGASYRGDGNLIIAGNEDGKLRLFDSDGRVPLRIFKGHSGPVHVSKFCNDLTRIFSASDDKTVRVWDVATENVLCKFSEHQDYIRCGALCKSSVNMIATGSYDHTVRIYDTRTKESISTIDHEQPVESVLIYPSGSMLLSAGGNSIKVWDLLQGGKLLTTLTHHHKTITCMAFNHDYSRLLSGGLDRHVKIYDVVSYDNVHTIDYPASILSIAVSNQDKTVAVGMVDKMLSLRHRKEPKKEEGWKVHKRASHGYYVQGKDYTPNNDDIVINEATREFLPDYDLHLKKFDHSKALDAALKPQVQNKRPEVTVAVMQELIRRGRLEAAVAGRSSKRLAHLLKFLNKYITKISFSPTLVDVADALVEIYTSQIQEHSPVVKALFLRLYNITKNESEIHRQMYSIMGCMDAIMSSNSSSVTSAIKPL